MSNPAVITLDSVNDKKSIFKRFVLEDNIGESIHLHIDNIRVDFTIKEFLEFSKMVRIALKELNILNGYDIDKFDEHFLKSCADFLSDLIEIKKEKVKLKDLKAISFFKFKDIKLTKIVSLSKTPAYKFLKGNTKEWLDYPQFNYFGVSNEGRLLKLKESIEKHGYPYDDRYIVLFNGQNLIRDGQHRAVVLAYLYGLDYEIEILRFYFRGDKHYFRNIYLKNMKILSKWFIKKVYKKLKGYLK